jgi:hypothetical protein
VAGAICEQRNQTTLAAGNHLPGKMIVGLTAEQRNAPIARIRALGT